jgi:hypothetical protein
VAVWRPTGEAQRQARGQCQSMTFQMADAGLVRVRSANTRRHRGTVSLGVSAKARAMTAAGRASSVSGGDAPRAAGSLPNFSMSTLQELSNGGYAVARRLEGAVGLGNFE